MPQETQNEEMKESMKFYIPPVDFEGYPIKADCLEVLKRAIFKLATVFERLSLFTGDAGANELESGQIVEEIKHNNTNLVSDLMESYLV